jgi:hypothetical protein
MSTATTKKPSWRDDFIGVIEEARKDPAAAAALDAAKAKKEAEAALQAKLKQEFEQNCANFHAWKKANPYIMKDFWTPGVPEPDEVGWRVEPKCIRRQVPNRESCPYCKKA